jgi:hypothetical protein
MKIHALTLFTALLLAPLVSLHAALAVGQELIEGKTYMHLVGVAIELEDQQHVTIRRCFFMDVGVAIRLKNCRNVTVDSCVMADLTIQGIDIREGCSDIRIVNNHMGGFRSDVQGGHFISTEKTDAPRQFRITIAGNTLLGNGKSWVKGRKNGAAGDMIALRSVSGFTMSGNDLSGGGEFGMDCLYGCEDGIIAHNRIHQIDGTGLLIGYGVKNINVYGNNIVDCGCSFETDGSANDITHQAGIHCRNGVENVLITSNLICRKQAEEMRYGIHLRETTGVIKGNLIAGVGETIHIPRSLADSVKIE